MCSLCRGRVTAPIQTAGKETSVCSSGTACGTQRLRLLVSCRGTSCSCTKISMQAPKPHSKRHFQQRDLWTTMHMWSVTCKSISPGQLSKVVLPTRLVTKSTSLCSRILRVLRTLLRVPTVELFSELWIAFLAHCRNYLESAHGCRKPGSNVHHSNSCRCDF